MLSPFEKVVAIPDAVPRAVCDEWVERLSKVQTRQGGIYKHHQGEKIVDLNSRVAREYQVDFGDEFDDIKFHMWELGREINAEHYDFVLDGDEDRMLYLHYEQGGFFNEHNDSPWDSEFGHKKLVMVLQLSREEDFNGGILWINRHGAQPQGQGSLVVFPIQMPHSVSGINGDRKMLVNWCTARSHFR